MRRRFREALAVYGVWGGRKSCARRQRIRGYKLGILELRKREWVSHVAMGGTYAIDGYTFAIHTDCDFGALPLLDAANAANASSVHPSIGRAHGLRQRRQSEGGANGLIGRHVVCQTLQSEYLRSA